MNFVFKMMNSALNPGLDEELVAENREKVKVRLIYMPRD